MLIYIQNAKKGIPNDLNEWKSKKPCGGSCERLRLMTDHMGLSFYSSLYSLTLIDENTMSHFNSELVKPQNFVKGLSMSIGYSL